MNFSSFMACAVCFGDPSSLLSKGAVAGVLVLLGVVVLVLSLIASVWYRWAKRARQLEQLSS